MEFDYEYCFSFSLSDQMPQDVADCLSRFAAGEQVENRPATGADAAEVDDADLFRLLLDQKSGGFAQVMRFKPLQSDPAWSLVVWGAAPAENFYMPFPALAEWLAQWAHFDGWAGYYHRRTLDHPTMIYFSGGKPYMLQVTGSPVGMIDGAPYPQPTVQGEDEEDWEE